MPVIRAKSRDASPSTAAKSLHRVAAYTRKSTDQSEVHESEKLHRDIRSSGRSKETIQALGRLAWNFTRKQLDGKDLGLEFDVQRHDRFGRTLAYVWLTDGRLFNLLILREGYAQVLTIPPNIRYASLFVACQREARENRRGLWGP